MVRCDGTGRVVAPPCFPPRSTGHHNTPACLPAYLPGRVQGAGGVITDWRGQALHWQPSATDTKEQLVASWPGEVAAAGHPDLHKKVLQLLDWRKS